MRYVDEAVSVETLLGRVLMAQVFPHVACVTWQCKAINEIDGCSLRQFSCLGLCIYGALLLVPHQGIICMLSCESPKSYAKPIQRP